ncbi:hypothetical protein [Butyrivibrio sp. INlla14]|uniref:hypothetical protein n=1 Tax=Butyrivibrio sp. INlla14 TaxID=1520808 RepID=UPI0008769902|nr:hypothetical protein [Butyrivibrio sp. INlla14]SCY40257.1 hypothetical protein SAMN02910371_02152 [Butyrivibrio sp. INlla14]
MNRTRKIKEIIGSVLEERGIKYLRKEHGIVWNFERKVGEVVQNVIIQQHNQYDKEYKISFWTSARGNGVKEIGNILEKYKDKEYWPAETDEEFIKVLNFFASFIKDYGFDLLEDMLTEKPDSFETPERKQYFKQHWRELAKKYDDIYHVLGNGTAEDQLRHIDDILFENREAEETPEKVEEVNEFLLGMAAVLTEVIIRFQGNGELVFDSYRVEIKLEKEIFNIWPIYVIVQAWLRYHKNGDRSEKIVWRQTRMSATMKICK